MAEQNNPGREKLVKNIRDQLGYLVSRVELATKNGHNDAAVIAENTICGLLNLVYHWNLVNANLSEHMNFPGVDLVDDTKRIAVQVTAQNTRNKVKDMLDKFEKHGLEEKYSELHMVVLTNQEPSQGMRSIKTSCFDGESSIKNMPRIMQRIQNMDIEELEKISAYLDRENGSPGMNSGAAGEKKDPVRKQQKAEVHPLKKRSWAAWIGAAAALTVLGIGIAAELPMLWLGAAALLPALVIYGSRQHDQYASQIAMRNILMKNAYSNPETEQQEYAFNTQARRCQVGTITFLDSLKLVPDNAADASQLQNGMVRAWAVPNGALYDLYIAADGIIFAPDDSSSLFREMINLTKIDFNNAFSTINAENMHSLFNNCRSLKELDIRFFKTGKVTDMAGMFCRCAALTQLDLRGFDTSGVEKMYSMFYGCSGLTELKLGRFNTSRVDSMYNMFSGCKNLTKLNVSCFDTGNVKNMSYMFDGCAAVKELDVGNFVTSQVMDMACMFRFCGKVKALEVKGFDTSNVMNMQEMFRCCYALKDVNPGHFNTEKVTNMRLMFSDCHALPELKLNGYVTTRVTNMHGMFYSCFCLTDLDVSGFDTAGVTDMRAMFCRCKELTELKLSHFATKQVKTMAFMFQGCEKLTDLNIEGWNLSSVTEYESFMNPGRTVNGRPWEELFS